MSTPPDNCLDQQIKAKTSVSSAPKIIDKLMARKKDGREMLHHALGDSISASSQTFSHESSLQDCMKTWMQLKAQIQKAPSDVHKLACHFAYS